MQASYSSGSAPFYRAYCVETTGALANIVEFMHSGLMLPDIRACEPLISHIVCMHVLIVVDKINHILSQRHHPTRTQFVEYLWYSGLYHFTLHYYYVPSDLIS